MSTRIYAETRLPTVHGQFRCRCYRDDQGQEAIALATPFFDRRATVNVRIHSSCITGEVFGSRRCDCGEQFDRSLAYIEKETGVLIYLFQEGRGIGLGDKIRAYALQDLGYDTLQANEIINVPVDARNYSQAVEILRDLQITRVRLLTNNPLKVEAVNRGGIEVTQQLPIVIAGNRENSVYLQTKREKCGHTL